MADRYLILSDLHLSDVEDRPDGWKYFKRSRYSADADFAALLARTRRGERPNDRTILVLNGDIYDLDLVTALPEDPPFRVRWLERRCGLAPTPEKAAWKLSRILEDHPGFVDALARHLGTGGEVVHVLGNHDRELVFEPVRALLVETLKKSAARQGLRIPEGSLRLEPWFFHVPGLLYAEHGNQYDEYNAYRDVLHPLAEEDGEPRLVEPMGNLSNRWILSAFGTFNPFSADYLLGPWGYVRHWARHYARRLRPYVRAFLFGASLVLLSLMRTRRRDSKKPERPESLASWADRCGLPVETLEALAALQARPAHERAGLVLRTLWYDRVFLGLGSAAGLAAALLGSWPPGLALAMALALPSAWVFYEARLRQQTVFEVRHRLPRVAARIAELLSVSLVAIGHDHLPKRQALDGGATFVDTGTWAPMTEGGFEGPLQAGFRNYTLLVRKDGRVAVHTGSWLDDSRQASVPRRAPATLAPALTPPLGLALAPFEAGASPAPPAPGR